MEAGAGIEPAVEILQTSALPLGHPANIIYIKLKRGSGQMTLEPLNLERVTGLEPVTSTLARLRSTN